MSSGSLQVSIRGRQVFLVLWLSLILLPFNLVANAAAPADCNNAALLYFQAIQKYPEYPELSSEEYQAVNAFIRDSTQMTATVRQFLAKCQESIELVKAASHIEYCNWGHEYSQGFVGYVSSTHFTEIRNLAKMLCADAIMHAKDGNQKTALEYGLVFNTFSEHVGNDSILAQLVSQSVSVYATNTIRTTLGYDQVTHETLTWLHGELVTRQSSIQSYFQSLDSELRLALSAAKYDDIFSQVKEDAAAGGYPGSMETMTDDELLSHMSKPIQYFKNYMKRTISLDMSYLQIMTDIEQIADTTTLIYEVDYPSIVQTCLSLSTAFTFYYPLAVRNEAEFALTQTAIELYDLVAQTGNLPDVLPDYLPKDPFSGTPFEYEITPEGFVLRFHELVTSGESKSHERTFIVPALKEVIEEEVIGPGGR